VNIMKITKKIRAFNNTSGVGIARDSRGRLKVISNKSNGKTLRAGMSVLTVSTAGKEVPR